MRGKTALLFCMLCAAILFSGCVERGQEETEKPSIDDVNYEISLFTDDVRVFECLNCGEIAAACKCHEKLGYPEFVCCDCVKTNYRVCYTCGKVVWYEDAYGEGDVYLCDTCAEAHSSVDNPFYIDGEPYHFEVAVPQE